MPSEDVRICLDKNLLGERESLLANVARSQRHNANDARMAAPAVDKDAQARLTAVEDAIGAASITLRITGVDRLKYNSWLLACPPRKGKVGESFDPSKFFMLAAKNSAKYVDESGDEHDISPDEWKELDKTITDGEHDRIAQAVLNVNRTAGAQSIDFLGSGSATTRDSFGISVSPEASASRRGDSGAGSRKKSTAKK
ncbi:MULTISPECIES: hypothetical protein [unclassified Microbacterium]|uniref:hypothetical protein n=1 Tax=unclassified Microbacterium TaxID=2609290 RepID=UPI000EA9C585|nr:MULTISPECIES: hypothetical protein [unclassified Microbacterium]MBT2485814.1 hypothetical protein [Microbacterium sp. ISL-108]RKN68577.1 hypothetical protein D7252_13950 [Microbacterium sp. CGR2]